MRYGIVSMRALSESTATRINILDHSAITRIAILLCFGIYVRIFRCMVQCDAVSNPVSVNTLHGFNMSRSFGMNFVGKMDISQPIETVGS